MSRVLQKELRIFQEVETEEQLRIGITVCAIFGKHGKSVWYVKSRTQSRTVVKADVEWQDDSRHCNPQIMWLLVHRAVISTLPDPKTHFYKKCRGCKKHVYTF